MPASSRCGRKVRKAKTVFGLANSDDSSPIVVMRHSRPYVVMMSPERYEALASSSNLIQGTTTNDGKDDEKKG